MLLSVICNDQIKVILFMGRAKIVKVMVIMGKQKLLKEHIICGQNKVSGSKDSKKINK